MSLLFNIEQFLIIKEIFNGFVFIRKILQNNSNTNSTTTIIIYEDVQQYLDDNKCKILGSPGT